MFEAQSLQLSLVPLARGSVSDSGCSEQKKAPSPLRLFLSCSTYQLYQSDCALPVIEDQQKCGPVDKCIPAVVRSMIAQLRQVSKNEQVWRHFSSSTTLTSTLSSLELETMVIALNSSLYSYRCNLAKP